MIFCGSGHAVVGETELMADGLCYLCGMLHFIAVSDSNVHFHPKCPRCENTLRLNGVDVETEELEPDHVKYHLNWRYSPCKNHSDGVNPVQASRLQESFARGELI